jgi:5-methylcytosine-specific restriction endonuclease McrA
MKCRQCNRQYRSTTTNSSHMMCDRCWETNGEAILAALVAGTYLVCGYGPCRHIFPSNNCRYCGRYCSKACRKANLDLHGHRRGDTKVKQQVFDRDSGKCLNCGSQYRLEASHIIADYYDGPFTPWNLQTLCHDCNHNYQIFGPKLSYSVCFLLHVPEELIRWASEHNTTIQHQRSHS